MIRNRLEAAADIVEIQQLAYRYAISVDSRDIATLASLYAERTLEDGTRVTPATIAERFEGMLHSSPLLILNVGNHLIDLDPKDCDRAKGIVYCRAELEDGEQWLVQQIAYHDEYVRRDGRWLFLSRSHLLYYGADLLNRPIGIAPAGLPENRYGKGSMPQYWDTYREYFARHPGSPHY